MITEDYCSFEVAKLLKEKGFDEYSLKNYWSSDKELHDWKWELSYNKNSDGNRNTKDCAAPTHQMAMKWLREVHNIDICAFPYQADYILYSYNVKIYKDKEIYLTITDSKTYEESVEIAIKYCLKNLI